MGKSRKSRNEKDSKMARKRRKSTDPEFREEESDASTVASDGDSVASSQKQKKSTASSSKHSHRSQQHKQLSCTPSTVSTLSKESTEAEDNVSLEEDSPSVAKSAKSSSKGRPSASAAKEISDLKTRIKTFSMAKSQQVKDLEKKVTKVEKKLSEMTDDRDAALSDRDALKTKHDELIAKYKAVMEKLASSRSPDSNKSEGMVMQTRKTAKTKGWLRFKFLNSNKQLRMGSIIVMDEMQLEDCTHYNDDSEERQQEVAIAREQWLNLYSTDVRQGINEQRSYVQSEMKKIALAWLKDHKGQLPTPEEFAKIAQRNLDTGTVDSLLQQEIFDMYVLMLSACAGSATFGEKQRRTYTISKCKTQENKVAVPSGSEALVIVMYENCYQKWLNMHDYKEVQNKRGNIPKYSSKRHEETKQWMSKYSDSCSGNSPYGGWSKEGIVSFNAHTKVFKALRLENSDSYRSVEEAAMLRFSVIYEEDRKRKRRENGYGEETDSAGSSGRKKKKTARLDDSDEENEVMADFEEED